MANIGVIGDRDSAMLFKAVGVDTFYARTGDEASRHIYRMAREGYAVIFITEPLAMDAKEAISRFKSEAFPAIIPIPNNQGSTGLSMANIKANVEKAIGADILFSEER